LPPHGGPMARGRNEAAPQRNEETSLPTIMRSSPVGGARCALVHGVLVTLAAAMSCGLLVGQAPLTVHRALPHVRTLPTDLVHGVLWRW
jgi:hypothetical protein